MCQATACHPLLSQLISNKQPMSGWEIYIYYMGKDVQVLCAHVLLLWHNGLNFLQHKREELSRCKSHSCDYDSRSTICHLISVFIPSSPPPVHFALSIPYFYFSNPSHLFTSRTWRQKRREQHTLNRHILSHTRERVVRIAKKKTIIYNEDVATIRFPKSVWRT